MTSRFLTALMLVLSTILLASAFFPVPRPRPVRSLALLGTGLVILAGVTRRHYADKE